MGQNHQNKRVLLEVKHLKKSFGEKTVLKDINFSLKSGEIVGLLGLNGVGKSTCIRCLMGNIINYEGEISLFGKALKNGEHPKLADCGFLLEPSFYPYLSGEENLILLSNLHTKTLKSNIQTILNKIGLSNDKKKKVDQYSYGMRQRLGLAQALINKPELLILDEPTVGLDPMGVEALKKLLCNFVHNTGKAVLFSSHELENVQDICSRILLLSDGVIKIDDSLDHLLAEESYCIRPDHSFSKELEREIKSLFGEESNYALETNQITLYNHTDFNQVLRLLISRGTSLSSINTNQSQLKELFCKEQNKESL